MLGLTIPPVNIMIKICEGNLQPLGNLSNKVVIMEAAQIMVPTFWPYKNRQKKFGLAPVYENAMFDPSATSNRHPWRI